ncbi:acyl-CoA thioesterase [Catenulispora sp. NF23]|uniref:Acyl-CoA thioesterase n=1 Tax=Catenulispora pinistramenti TaxID=2705254 RepID=A0ABS5KV50_9ACTN|nr:thioesterase family protein [Catenulispora pinistramenti]MBS2537935.1 acyl-CoA thioesterase [Catenulispora pinistramenti]MBS2549927.1 acyl-CoA thioesterase [Catenulispora pinistramenti]
MVFSVPVTVRGYELDTQGHLNQAVYLQYTEHARWELLRAAGIGQNDLIAGGIGPVVLEANLKFLRELRGGEEVDVSCELQWAEGKVFQFKQQIVKKDGTVCADAVIVGGILDLAARKLVPNPAERLAAVASDPAVLGI